MSARFAAARRLSLLPLDAIYIHEDADPSRSAPLRAQIQDQGYLANPIMVARPGGGATDHALYPHLDGANRRTALAALGCDKIVTQIVDLDDPGEAQLFSWAHAVQLPCVAQFLGAVAALPGAHLSRCSPVQQTPEASDAAYLYMEDCTYRLRLVGPLALRLAALRQVVAAYQAPVVRHKLPVQPAPATLRPLLNGAAEQGTPLLVTFVPLTPDEFRELAVARLTAPAGVTRFVITGGRALGLNVPLDLLRPGASLDAAQRWLDAHVRRQRPRSMPPPTQVLEYCGLRAYDDPLICYDPEMQVLAAPAAA